MQTAVRRSTNGLEYDNSCGIPERFEHIILQGTLNVFLLGPRKHTAIVIIIIASSYRVVDLKWSGYYCVQQLGWVGCLYSLDWTTGLDYWTDLFASKNHFYTVINLTCL